MIDSFTDRWKNLSNFGMGKVYMPDGFLYPYREHAFQAQKTLDLTVRQQMFCIGTPADAKRLGRTVALRPDWEHIKIPVMQEVLRCAFGQNHFLRRLLRETGEQQL